MVTIAMLDPRIEAQLSANAIASAGLDLVARASTCDELLELATKRQVQVLIVNIGLLGERPIDILAKLTRVFQPELSLVVYYFAKRDLLKQITNPQTRTLRGPIMLDALRAQLTSLLVRDKLARDSSKR